jgi:hypothetical protein
VIGFAEFQIMDVFQASKVPGGLVVDRPGAGCNGQCPPTSSGWGVQPTPGYDLKAHLPAGATFEGATWSGATNWSVTPDGFLVRNANGSPNGPSSVTVQYSTLTDAGSCGQPPVSGQSSHCIVLRWNGASIGEGRPGGGADFGVRAVQLCDRSFRSCLDQP